MYPDPDTSAAAARQPRGMVKINGEIIKPWIDWDVESNNFHESDRFTVSLALSQLVAPQDAAWFSAQAKLRVEILAGFPTEPTNFGAADLDSLILGMVDELTFDPVSRTLYLTGRDLTSLLIDAKTTEKWQTQTASQIATTLATRHGLKPVVTSTSTPVGRYYQIDHVSMTSADSEWEFLTWLANQEGFVAYVKGNELHFEPRPDPAKADPFVITWQEPNSTTGYFKSNVQRISFRRTLTVGRGVVVQVRSWNQKQKNGFNATYPTSSAKGIKPGSSSAPAQVYSYVVPNLTQEQALQRAQSLYNDIIRHEMRFNAELPASNKLMPTSVVKITGTGTDFDQLYFPESIEREMSNGGGYTMRIAAKNHSDQTSLVP